MILEILFKNIPPKHKVFFFQFHALNLEFIYYQQSKLTYFEPEKNW